MHLAVEGHVSASTQNQALSALLFLYKEVLAIDLPWLGNVVRAKQPKRLPVVLTRAIHLRRDSLKVKPFVVSLSNHERLNRPSFDRLRTNG